MWFLQRNEQIFAMIWLSFIHIWPACLQIPYQISNRKIRRRRKKKNEIKEEKTEISVRAVPCVRQKAAIPFCVLVPFVMQVIILACIFIYLATYQMTLMVCCDSFASPDLCVPLLLLLLLLRSFFFCPPPNDMVCEMFANFLLRSKTEKSSTTFKYLILIAMLFCHFHSHSHSIEHSE